MSYQKEKIGFENESERKNRAREGDRSLPHALPLTITNDIHAAIWIKARRESKNGGKLRVHGPAARSRDGAHCKLSNTLRSAKFVAKCAWSAFNLVFRTHHVFQTMLTSGLDNHVRTARLGPWTACMIPKSLRRCVPHSPLQHDAQVTWRTGR